MKAGSVALNETLVDTFKVLGRALKEYAPKPEIQKVGTVSYIGAGVARVTGLSGVKSEELLRFVGEKMGMAFNLDQKEIGVILLDEREGLSAGSDVQRTGRLMDAPIGDGLLGRVVDAQGHPLDNLGTLGVTRRQPVEMPAPGIMDRAPVTVPLQTGLKVVDALIPIGRGQRELILGDRQTGKTAIALDTIINQKDKDVICIYCGIGKRGSALAKVIADLKAHHAMAYCIVMVTTEEDPPGLVFMAPYAATTMGEYFMEQGRDVLIVYDDLTRHARAYRELSLLLRRPPGREAFPGDVFYIHSRLLERSTHLGNELGGGSLTALPVIETEAQNMSAYIPTNLISITDGQVYLSPELFQKGNLPAVDVGKSVSRVGGKTQLRAYRAVAGDLRLSYSQFEELEAFSRFGTRLDDDTRKTLERGRRVREVLKQPQYAPLSVSEQIAALVAVNRGVFDELDVKELVEAERRVGKTVKEELSDLCDRIERGEELAEEDIQTLFTAAQRAVAGLKKQEKQHANDRGLEEKDREHPGPPVSSEDHEGAGSGEHPPV
jgi:F-type H+/Na+-transporting ATPase subunit alpha